MRDIFRKLYTQQKSNAKQRGVEFRLTLEEWKQIWLDSGKWEQRGRGADKYCMCRIGDTGGTKHYRSKGGVVTPEGFFESTKQAAAALGIPVPTVQWRCKYQKLGFAYKDNLAFA